MSVDSAPDAATRAADARARADARLSARIADLSVDDDARLGERTRLAVSRLLGETIDGIESDLRTQAARLLMAKGATAAATALLAGSDAAARLAAADLLRDETLIEVLVARVQHRAIAEALPVTREGAEEMSLLVRLAAVPDRVVAGAARALLTADNATTAALPAPVRRRLIWGVAAAIRPALAAADTDVAIAEAVSRSLSAPDDGEQVEIAAMRLAAAIDARPDELRPLLLEALGDRRLSLFVAVLAQAAELDYPRVEAMVIEPDDERLWLLLRAAALDRATIARIALALSDADPRRDIETFADRLDAIASVDPAEARGALAPETLAPAYRHAIRALARAERA